MTRQRFHHTMDLIPIPVGGVKDRGGGVIKFLPEKGERSIHTLPL